MTGSRDIAAARQSAVSSYGSSEVCDKKSESPLSVPAAASSASSVTVEAVGVDAAVVQGFAQVL